MERPLTFAHPRVTMYWLAPHFPPFIGLSRNIIRELCMYLEDFPCILDIVKGHMKAYDPIRNQWKSLYPLKQWISSSYLTAIVVLEHTGSLFLCGGLTYFSTPHSALSSAYIARPTEVTALPRMLLARYGHGAVYVKCSECVFVYGGSCGSKS